MKIKDVVTTLESFAPLPLQESYDNAGLQVGLTAAEVSGVLLCLDVTEQVVQEAEKEGCNLIVAHHPLLFKGLKRVSNLSQPERVVRMAVQKDIAIYAAHTNLDNAQGGVNTEIANRLGLLHLQPLLPSAPGSEMGVMGELPDALSACKFLQQVKEAFGVDCLMHNELLQRPVQKVALCGGAGAFMLGDAIRMGADAFLTGEMHYHDYFGHEQEIQIGVLGHYQSEQYTTCLLKRVLREAFPDTKLIVSEVNTNPIQYMI